MQRAFVVACRHATRRPLTTTAHEDVATTSSRVASRQPGRKRLLDEMLRVDHAGEVGAVDIYAGQLWALRNAPAAAATIAVRGGVEGATALFA